jgi:hypothetical protein
VVDPVAFYQLVETDGVDPSLYQWKGSGFAAMLAGVMRQEAGI